MQSIDDPCPFGKYLKQSYHQLNLSSPQREILTLSTSYGLIDKMHRIKLAHSNQSNMPNDK